MNRWLFSLTVSLMAANGYAADSPAYTAKQLTDLPVSDWITNGGNLYNQR
jgi:hypothetical protein